MNNMHVILIVSVMLVILIAPLSDASEYNTLKYNKYVPKWRDTIVPDRIGHFSILNGPALDMQDSSYLSDGSRSGSNLSSWHQVSFSYKLSNSLNFVINPRFTYDYNLDEANIDNPVTGITGTWYKNQRLTVSGGFNSTIFPVTERDRNDKIIANPGGLQDINYSFNSKFSAGSWFWGRYMIAESELVDRSQFPIFVSPYTSYTVNDTIGFTAFYQYNGNIEELEEVNIQTDDSLNLLSSVKINKLLTLQPIVTLFRATEFNPAAGNLNLWVSGRFY